MPEPSVLAIAGGVGGAKLALGLSHVLPPDKLSIVVNTGDDETFHGLHVSPDLDSVTYALAGMTNADTGWGIATDSFRTLGALERLGAETWFGLGDLDFATHLRRTELLASGASLTDATAEITKHLGIEHEIVPMTDAPVRTIAITEEGDLAFQEYFVHQGCEPKIKGVRFEGCETSKPSFPFAKALRGSSAIVFCPSNPLVSIGPVLAVSGVYDLIEGFPGPRIAVSPIVGGQALKGPAAKMMAELGEEVSCVGVAKRFMGICDALVIDEVDREHAHAIEAMGMRAIVTGTIMRTDDDKDRLAREIIDVIDRWSR
ncbi:MAG: 2-phospho-L-lactate transferase [Chloroflexi bacterium]|nr:2-phospho-L-lactate transferase [Chloroflexota bacterium]